MEETVGVESAVEGDTAVTRGGSVNTAGTQDNDAPVFLEPMVPERS